MRERTAVKAAWFVPGREGMSNLSFLFNKCSRDYMNILVSTDSPAHKMQKSSEKYIDTFLMSLDDGKNRSFDFYKFAEN
jgi:hypothetical protein